MPATVPWSHPKYTNTCTCDNFLTIILLQCQQDHQFCNKFGTSPSELALKGALSLMLNGDMENGKSVILDYINSVIGFSKNGPLFDCYGSEYDKCLKAFDNVWRLYMSLKFLSKFCPSNKSKRFVKSYSFQSPTINNSFIDQVQHQFPLVNTCSGGYCGAKFKGIPPKGSSCHENVSYDTSTGTEIPFYECMGQLFVMQSRFVSKTLWIIPFCISSIEGSKLADIPLSLHIFGSNYILGGTTLYVSGHFTAIVMWRGKRLFYDGNDHPN